MAAALCCIAAATVSVSCSDKDDTSNAEEEMTDTEPVDKTPTEDAMTTVTDAKAYVFEGSYGDIGQKVLARVKNRQQGIDKDTKLIVIPGEKYVTLTNEQRGDIIAAYNNGAKILVDRPSAQETMLIGMYIPLGITSVVETETAPNDEAVEMWGFNLSSDMFTMDITLKDSTDTSAANRAVLDGYEEGLFADEAAEWVNTDQNTAVKASMPRAAKRAGTQLSGILDAQTDTWVASVSTNYFGKLKDKQTPYVVFTTIYAVHKFQDDRDYYLIDQTLTGNNRTFWMGEWTQKNYKADDDGGKHNWRMQGFYANNWGLENRMTTGGWDDYVKIGDGLTLVKHSPASTNASTTTSTSTSWSVGGELGTGGASITGGISGSVGSSQTLMDISTEDKCMNGTTCGNNAWWLYTIDPWRQVKEKMKCYFVDPPTAAIQTFTCEQSWLWQLDNASRYKELYLRTDFNIELYRTLIRNPFVCYARWENAHVWNVHQFKIDLPKRTK